MLCLVIVMSWLAGCVSLEPQKDSSRFYTLSKPSATQDASVASYVMSDPSALRRVGVMLPTFPAYLQRLQIVERNAEGDLRVHGFNRWAEQLNEGFLRVLTRELYERIREDRLKINLSSYPNINDAEYILRIHVYAFEPLAEGKVVLEAAWRLEPVEDTQAVIYNSEIMRFELPWEVGNYSRLTAAMQNLVKQFAEEVPLSEIAGDSLDKSKH